jgi:hypothetical protein
MQLTLTVDEAQTLRRVLQHYLPDLRREFAHTDIASRELRHELVRREELCERLLAALEREVGPAPVG